jgi:hypothetical protein
MSKSINNVVILGGGTAGWVSTGLLAKKLNPLDTKNTITLIESKTIGSIGVGEGTWPTMRATLKKIGLSGTDLISQCDATFKQASKFVSWVYNTTSDFYYHPFNSPKTYPHINLPLYWQLQTNKDVSFSASVSCQEATCEDGLAPKTLATAKYKGLANYGYHLDATKFCASLKKHCTERLNINCVQDEVAEVVKNSNGHIKSLTCSEHSSISELVKSRLGLCQYEAPSDYDFPNQFDVFSAASYQYVLYGMGFDTNFSSARHNFNETDKATKAFDMKNKEQANLYSNLSVHRDLINNVKQYGFGRI